MLHKIKVYLNKFHYLAFAYKVVISFYQKDGLQRANGLAYVLLMSFVPFFISSASIVSLFLPASFYYKLETVIFAEYLPVIGKEVAYYVRDFQAHAVGLSLVSLFFLFVTAISMIITLRSHLDQLLGNKVKEQRYPGLNLVLAVVLFVGLIIAGVIILGLREIVTHYMPASILARIGFLFGVFQYLTSIAAFTIIYRFVPRSKIHTRSAFSAGLSAALMFEFSKYIFTIYIKKFATNHILYGSLAIIPIFLLWLYIISIILLLCAQVMSLLDHNFDEK